MGLGVPVPLEFPNLTPRQPERSYQRCLVDPAVVPQNLSAAAEPVLGLPNSSPRRAQPAISSLQYLLRKLPARMQ